MTRKPLSPEEIEKIKTMYHNYRFSFRTIAIKMHRDYYLVKQVIFPEFERKKKTVPDGYFDVNDFKKTITI